jgi:hypothetical protein
LLSSIEVEIRDSQSNSLVGIASLFRGKVRLDVPDARHRNRLNRFFDEVEFRYEGAASQKWAEIDRAITDRAPWAAVVTPGGVDFLSERVGNYQFSPGGLGVLLSQLWLT